jgi:four helix bundle protein
MIHKRHKELPVWDCAMDLVAETYRFCTTLPAAEQFGLRTQMQRAAVSIPSNIAEGSARASSKELHQYLSIALGSLAELDAQLEVCGRLKIGSGYDALQQAIDDAYAQLTPMRAAVRRKLEAE